MTYFWWVTVVYLGIITFSYTDANQGQDPCLGWTVGIVNSTTVSCDSTFVGAQ